MGLRVGCPGKDLVSAQDSACVLPGSRRAGCHSRAARSRVPAPSAHRLFCVHLAVPSGKDFIKPVLCVWEAGVCCGDDGEGDEACVPGDTLKPVKEGKQGYHELS